MVKWRVVGKDAKRVIINFEAVGDGFDDDGFFTIIDFPVELGGWEFGTKAKTANIEPIEQCTRFGDGGTAAEDPGQDFELRNIVFAVDVIVVDGVTDEIEPGHTETFFVDGIIKQRVIFGLVGDELIGRNRGKVGDANDGVMRFEQTDFAEIEWEIAGNDDGGFAIGELVVKVATEIRFFGLISSSGAHN